jgi:hypothetical protein
MMKKFSYTILSTIGFSLSFGVCGFIYAQGQVEVEWDNPKKYRDVRATSGTSHKFRQSTFKKLDEYLLKLAEALPDGHKLMFKVTDLDLAGQVWPASFAGFGHGATDIRVIKSVDVPRMNFNYELLGVTGEVLQHAEVKLKDLSFLERGNRHFPSESLRYEKNMLKQWFSKEFKEVLKPEKA